MRDWKITIYIDADRIDPEQLMEDIEHLICPDPTEPGHACRLSAMSSTPVTDD